MSTLDTGLTLIRTAAGRVSAANGWMGNAFKGWMPTGLYARALLIMIVPMVVLQSVVAFVFMERHWNTVTRRLSAAVVQDVAGLIDVYKGYPQDKDRAQLRRIAQQRLGLVVDFLPVGDMPPPGPEAVLLAARPVALGAAWPADRPAVLDRYRRPLQSGGNPHPARRRGDADLRPAQRGLCLEFGDLPVLDGRHLVDPADRRGAVPAQPDQADPAAGRRRRKLRQGPRGAELPPPRRARSAPRRAGLPRDESAHRALDRAAHRDAGRRQSHDLRTILTRFKLELALIGDSPEVDGMRKDVDEMSGMLEAYLAFARGDSGEQAQPTDMAQALEELRSDAERNGHTATVAFHGLPVVTVKPASFKRCLANLVPTRRGTPMRSRSPATAITAI